MTENPTPPSKDPTPPVLRENSLMRLTDRPWALIAVLIGAVALLAGLNQLIGSGNIEVVSPSDASAASTPLATTSPATTPGTEEPAPTPFPSVEVFRATPTPLPTLSPGTPTARPSTTPIPPTETAVPPTATPRPTTAPTSIPTAAPSATPEASTATPTAVGGTATTEPVTATAVPPSETPTTVATVEPTATAIVAPSATAVSPTATTPVASPEPTTAATPAATSTPEPDGTHAGLTVAEAEANFISAINDHRVDQGLTVLSHDPTLSQTARDWSMHMAQVDGIPHNPDLKAIGAAENVGASTGSWLDVQNAFESSPGHEGNMLLPNVTRVGVGVSYASGKIYVSQVFIQ